MPAAAVIPAPRVYTNVVAVKTLVVAIRHHCYEPDSHFFKMVESLISM